MTEPIKFNIEIRGNKDTIGKVSVFERRKLDKIRKQVKKSTKAIAKESRAKAPELDNWAFYSGKGKSRDYVWLGKKKYMRGHLKKSIGAKYKEQGLVGIVHAGKAGYAWLVEHGHKQKGGGVVKGQPYMKPAEEKERPKFEAEVRKIINESEEV